MLIDESFLDHCFDREKRLFYFISEEDTLDIEGSSFPFGYLTLILPVSGSISYETQFMEKTAGRGNLILFLHNEIIRITGISPDFHCHGIILSKEVRNERIFQAHSSLPLASFITAVEISGKDSEVLLDFGRCIKSLLDSGKAESDPVVLHLLSGIFIYVGKYYEKWLSAFPQKKDFNVIPQFLSLLFTNARVHKEVNFYADQMHMSKSRFSKVIKATTGLSAYKCIEKYLLFQACSMLRNSTESIKEIAFDLNFRDDSHFCRFFRRHMGETPQEYRSETAI